jgi:hypothetical protein
MSLNENELKVLNLLRHIYDLTHKDYATETSNI